MHISILISLLGRAGVLPSTVIRIPCKDFVVLVPVLEQSGTLWQARGTHQIVRWQLASMGAIVVKGLISAQSRLNTPCVLTTLFGNVAVAVVAGCFRFSPTASLALCATFLQAHRRILCRGSRTVVCTSSAHSAYIRGRIYALCLILAGPWHLLLSTQFVSRPINQMYDNPILT